MFKVGDKVRSLYSSHPNRTKDKIYEIVDVDSILGRAYIYYIDDMNLRNIAFPGHELFELVKEPSKREIDVYVDKNDLNNQKHGNWHYEKSISYPTKAKLIIEEEKEVTITESQFDEAYEKAHRNNRESYFKRDDMKKELGL